jgi:5-methylcytosine-specific restriction endonuclease McrA
MPDATRPCLDCGGPAGATPKGRPARRCADCIVARRRRYDLERYHSDPRRRQYDLERNARRYDGERVHHPSPAEGRQCMTCQRGIDHLRVDAQACGEFCRSWWREFDRRSGAFGCVECGGRRPLQKRLCDTCREENRRSAIRRKNYRRRAARGRGRYTMAGVAARDHHVCHLCEGTVDMRLPGTDPNGPTIDHLVPISNGGVDSPDNVALAHRACNVSRGARALV